MKNDKFMNDILLGKKIKLGYSDLWKNFEVEKDFIYRLLLKNGAEVEISDHPDYLIYGPSGYRNLEYNCVKIFYSGEAISPDFNICDYAMAFDDIEFEDRYLRVPLFLHPIYENDLQLALKKHEENNVRNKMVYAKEFCSFVVSNALADPFRTEFFAELSKYKKVNSGGRYLNNIGEAVDNKLMFNKRHKFSLAFENVSHNGYVTEKILQAFAAGCVPIYWGAPDIAKDFNKRAFINVMDYESIHDAVRAIIDIDNDDERYEAMLREPIFSSDKYLLDKYEKIEKFIMHIFEQSPLEAKRNTELFWNKMYADRLLSMKNANERENARFANIKRIIRKFDELK